MAQLLPTNRFLWKEIQFLSSGSYGEVYKLFWFKDSKTQVAAKHFKGSYADASEEFRKEVQNLRKLKHPNIIKLYGTTQDKASKPFLIMEYAQNGSLHQYIHDKKKRPVQMSYIALHNLMLQLAEGVAYLHGQQPVVLHRDLKPGNLLLTNNYRTLKICDFGTVREKATKMTHRQGTEWYMAPEMANCKEKYTEKCDVYSFGIILWEVFSEKMPYSHLLSTGDVLNKVIHEDMRPNLEDVKQMKNRANIIFLIKNCWEKYPGMRPTMDVVRFILSKELGSSVREPTEQDYIFNNV